MLGNRADRVALGFAFDTLRAHRSRSVLAVTGVVIGIVTVVLIASVLRNVRTQVEALFQGLGANNVFAFHLSGDPYSSPSEREAARRPLDVSFREPLERLSDNIARVGMQVIIPAIVNGRPLVASAGRLESDALLAEGSSAQTFEIVGAQLAVGRAFTAIEEQTGARVAVIGAAVVRSLFPNGPALGREVRLNGVAVRVVGVAEPRPGGAFGENRQDSVITIPVRTAARLYPDARNVVLYIEAEAGRRSEARADAEVILRNLRGLSPGQDNDFNLSTSDQIIAVLNRVGNAVGGATVALAGISLFIGSIGIANVMVISVTERTREIGVRRALGATRASVRRQFLIEAAVLSGIGGLCGVLLAGMIGFLITVALPRYDARLPWDAAIAGVLVSIAVGIAAGYVPATRASSVDPIEALRHE